MAGPLDGDGQLPLVSGTGAGDTAGDNLGPLGQIPAQAGKVAIVDATTIAMEEIGRSIPNTAMLGAFAKATGLVDAKTLFDNIAAEFGESNRAAAMRAYDAVQVN